MHKYDEQIKLVINKYARDKFKSERDDLYQEAYSALLEAGDKVNSPSFAYKIVKDRVIDVLRGEWRTRKREIESVEVGKDVLAGIESVLDLQTALLRLNHDEQVVINAIYYEGKNLNEVGVQTGHSRHWVWETKQSAINKLRAIIKEGEYGS